MMFTMQSNKLKIKLEKAKKLNKETTPHLFLIIHDKLDSIDIVNYLKSFKMDQRDLVPVG